MHRGVESITFSASDQETGIYRGIVEIDGVPVHAEIIDDNSGRCRDARPNDGDPFQFFYRVPCKTSANGTLHFDTRAVSDGVHELSVRVEDAAGNRATVFGAQPISVDNSSAGAPNDSGLGQQSSVASSPLASQQRGTFTSAPATISALPVGRREALIRVPYGRAVPISGYLRSAEGLPIANGRINISTRIRLRGGRREQARPVSTDASGRFRYVASAGASRAVDFSYESEPHDGRPPPTTSVDLRVRAKVTLRINRRRLRNGQRARYSGVLAGPQAQRKYVDIRVLVGRQWRPVCSARTDARGAYKCSYRFRRTFRPTQYTFRARIRRQETLPYEPAWSSGRRLRVSP